MSTLLKDVIEIPEHAGTDDYVLKLTESTGDEHIRTTLDEYVLTPSLEQNLTTALQLVADATRQNQSKAARLLGSFGSGKSHFMAVLYALLGNNLGLREGENLDKFKNLTGQCDESLSGKKILRLTYHLLGAKSLDEAILKGYVRQVRTLHPDATLPPVHLSDGLLEDAERLRGRLGDNTFLEQLGGDQAPGDAWGAVLGGGAWDIDRYKAALSAPLESTERSELVTALVDNLFGSFTNQADFVDLDTGFVLIADHAKSLGYDAIALFLDELVLWLAFSVRDTEFFSRESQKISKLVEAAGTRRAIPLISFVSQQMDLRKWFGDAGASGAEQEALDRAFHFQEGRFLKIELGDDNLAQVAHARLLKPKPGMEQVLQEAFRNVTRTPEVWDVLRDSMNTSDDHKGASEQEFELTYPFSPALVSTLRVLSSVMQRERTALKVMQRMLVDRRNTLTVDDLIPVGDAFDYIVSGNQPLDSTMAGKFKAATELFQAKLRPQLMTKHSVTQQQLDQGTVPDGYRTGDRIAKTLLLSAIAEKVPALQDLTASRLAALNHGSIRTRLRTGAPRVALAAVHEWVEGGVPEIKVGDGTNPVIHVMLADVDYESVLERVRGEDNMGRRRALMRKLVHHALGVPDQDDLSGAATRQLVWRGSRREVDVVFGNVRDPSSVVTQAFENRPGTWRFIVDYPFDENNHSTAEDMQRLERLISGGIDRHTVVWLPYFFTDAALDELASLVKLDWLFPANGNADRWIEHSNHLSDADRSQALGILKNMHSGLTTRFETILKQAYGVEAAEHKWLLADSEVRTLTSLSMDFEPRLPAATSMQDAFDKLADQAFTNIYPAHPEFEPSSEEVRPAQFDLVRNYVEKACAHPEGRVPVERDDRKTLARIAGPLRVGTATETHYLFAEDRFAFWAGELDRAVNAAGMQAPLTVGVLKRHIQSLTPAWGLRPEAIDLVISAWTLLRKRAWVEAGSSIPTPAVGKLREHIELRAERLPGKQSWDAARNLASGLVSYTSPRTYLTGANVAEFADQMRSWASRKTSALQDVVDELSQAHRRLSFTAEDNDRIAVTQRLMEFVRTIESTRDNVALIDHMAATEFRVGVPTAAGIQNEAEADARALRGFKWQLIDAVIAGSDAADSRADEARALLRHLREVISIPGRHLAGELGSAENRVVDWVVTGQVPTPQPTAPGTATVGTTRPEFVATEPQLTDDSSIPAPATDPETVTLHGLDDIDSITSTLTAAYGKYGSRVRVSWWVEDQ
ncbi:DUF6079 family protein [Nocardia wallacei]|uniref:DUF6079 family protein n=1 Tax=Nocardia wallacei TaxID=480035 RepID=UPI002455CA79|nr:DUF6079 family protein [Nocardia wallacei]